MKETDGLLPDSVSVSVNPLCDLNEGKQLSLHTDTREAKQGMYPKSHFILIDDEVNSQVGYRFEQTIFLSVFLIVP